MIDCEEVKEEVVMHFEMPIPPNQQAQDRCDAKKNCVIRAQSLENSLQGSRSFVKSEEILHLVMPRN